MALYALKDRLRQSRRSRQRLQKAKRDLFPSREPVVLAGPFKGMRYITRDLEFHRGSTGSHADIEVASLRADAGFTAR